MAANMVNDSVLVDDEDRHFLKAYRWHLNNFGYVITNSSHINGRAKRVSLARVILDAADTEHVDHMNGNKLDNRRANLRAVTRSQNLQNRTRLTATNTSGYRGVSWSGARRKWVAKASIRSEARVRNVTIGYFEDRDAAGHAACAWRLANMSGYICRCPWKDEYATA